MDVRGTLDGIDEVATAAGLDPMSLRLSADELGSIRPPTHPVSERDAAEYFLRRIAAWTQRLVEEL